MKVAIIPARGGSKRIPRKNVKEFLGKPVIGYAIETVIASGLVDHVIVSTDDEEIASVASAFGAEVPFARPAGLSDDHATTDDVLVHAIRELQASHGPIALGCCVYPASPLITANLLRRGLELIEAHDASSAFPVVRYDFPLEQALTLEDGLHPRFRSHELVDARSQDLPVHYHDAGMFYWFRPERLVQSGKLFSDDSVVFEVPANACQDINTLDDWAVAELKYQRLERSAQ